MDSREEKYLNSKNRTLSFFKNNIFDILAAFVIIAVTALSLGAIELRVIEFRDFLNIVLECVPFYIAAAMLSANYYTKGTYLAKDSDVFKKAVDYYSNLVSELTGEQITKLSEFCLQYNDKVLRNMRETLLHTVALTLHQYDVYDEKCNGPMKVLPYDKLRNLYGEEVAKVIVKCKKLKIKGICPNILLGNVNSNDTTDLGLTEKQLAKKRTGSYAIVQIVSIFLMSLIGVKSVMEWGWIGILLTLFKVVYITVSSYYKHFDGYEDVSVHLVDHIYRKSDVIKEFLHWYNTDCISVDVNIQNDNKVTK